MHRWVLFLTLVVTARSQTTLVSECTSYPGLLPINAYIEGCYQPPCELPQLQDAVINILFKAPYPITSMSTLAVAYLSSVIPIPLPYPLGANGVTCNFLQNSYCPVLEGELLQYTLRMYIEPAFLVGTRVTVEFRIVDDNRNAVTCIRVPIVIVEGVSTSAGSLKNSTNLLQDLIE